MSRTLARAPRNGRVWSVVCALALVASLGAARGHDAAAQGEAGPKADPKPDEPTRDAPKAKKKKPARGDDVRRCVDFTQREDDGAIALRLDSTCTAPLACRLSWTLSCRRASGKKDAKIRDESAFSLAPDTAQEINASAAACGDDGWIIDDIVWSCAPPSD